MAEGDPPVPSRARAYALVFASAATAGSSVVVGKVGVGAVPVTTYLAWLFAFAAAFSAAWSLFAPPPGGRRMTRRAAVLIAANAALAGLGCWGWYSGLVRLDAALAAFLGRTEVLVTIALGIVILGERLNRFEVAGGMLALAGLAVMRFPFGRTVGPEHAEAITWVLLGSLGFGASEIFAKRAMRDSDPTTFALARNLLLAVGWMLAALLTGTATVPSGPVIASAAGLALMGPVIARVLYLSALRTLELSRASLVAQSVPLFTALAAFLVLGTSPQPHEWAGGFLLVTGTLLIVRGARPRVLPAVPAEP